ncbi:universal stress protein [Baekduia soli]|uniref:Universal stress protein n=1 Tax=Baekduia soli TaxID=496014 RepID=A0A5B8U5K0_9ACTN|nr:universal stress protein [Baekduia soli]QEC48300.1 universal stress protein [Baekduia soli]
MKVMAAVDGSTISPSVLDIAGRIAALLHADLEAIHVGDGLPATISHLLRDHRTPLRTADGLAAQELRRAAHEPDIAALVVGARGLPEGRHPAGHVTQELMTSLERPLVVVPPAGRPSHRMQRILVALDGSAAAAEALRPLMRAAQDAGLTIVVVHVLDPRTAPPFIDQPHHWCEAYIQEFRARNVVDGDAEIHLRAGDPPERLLDAARQLDADIVALAWSQTLAPGRAAVVRNAVADGELPVVLVPVAAS